MDKKPAIFRDPALQQAFDENGFVRFRLFSPEQVQRLHDFYLTTEAAHETIAGQKKFHATNETSNAQLIADADQFIKAVMAEEIDKHFAGYKTIAANYLVKQPSEQSVLGPHQDLRFVDESRFYSLNIWVATEPTHKINGGLRFIKGSHRWLDTVRALPSYPWPYRSIQDQLEPYFTDIQTETGDCVVLNHAAIHASYPNLSDHRRIAAILALIPEGADIRHYFLPGGDPAQQVEEYTMTLHDFIHLKVGQRPAHATLVRTFHHDFSAVGQDFLLSKAGPAPAATIHTSSQYDRFKQKISALFRLA